MTYLITALAIGFSTLWTIVALNYSMVEAPKKKKQAIPQMVIELNSLN